MKIKVPIVLILTLLICASYSHALIDLSIFGPKRYDRLKGAPTVYTDTFERCNPAQYALLKIQNGDGKETRIKAGSVYVNGVEVVKENEFKQLVPYIEKTVPVKDVNELKVVLKSGMQDDPNNKLMKEQSFLIIEVVGKGCDDTPPTISNTQPADGSLLNSGMPAISASYADNAGGTGIDAATASIKVDGSDVTSIASVSASGISYTPSSKLPDGEHTVAVSVSDKAHNASTLTWRFATDTVAPSVKITSHINNQYLNTPTINLSGTVSDELSGNPSGGVTVTVNGHSATVTGNTFTVSNLSLSEGADTITVEAKDPAGNVGTASITINLDTISPVVSISSPNANAYLNTPQINISGSVNEPVTSLKVNGVNIGAVVQSPYGFTKEMTLAEGPNTINIEVVDRAGNVGSSQIAVTLDTIPPAPPVFDALNTPTNISVATITGKAEPGSTVKVFTSDSATQIIGTVNADSSGMFNIPDITLSEGVNTFSATATDTVGNTSGLSQSVSATLDTKAPAAKIASHVNNQYLNAPTITLTGTLSDDITGNPGGVINVDVNGHSATATGNAFALSNLSLSEGANTITVEARDPAGNVSTDSIIINLDTVTPTVNISSPSANAYLNTPQITVIGSVNEPVTSLVVNGVNVGAIEQGVGGQGPGVSFNLEKLNLTEGSNTIIVTATDRAGNSGTAAIAVNLDTLAPTIQVLSPVHSTYVNTPNITVSGTISDAALENGGVVVKVNGFSVGAKQVVPASPAPFESNYALTEGENTITIVATDPAGNTATRTLTVTLDTIAPVISVTSPLQNAYADLPNITVSGTVTELHPSGFWINDAPVEATGQSPLQFNTGLTLVPGLNTINLKATDLAGNVSSASVTVTLDSTPPVVTITAPASGSLLNNPGVKVTGTVNEAVTSLTINGTLVVASGQGSGVGFNLENLTLLEGLNNIVVQAIDRAGNSGTASISVTVDSAAPDAPVLDSLSTPTKVSPVTIAGSSEAGATVKIYKDQTLTGTVTADSQGRFNFQNVTLTEGSSTFTATATDAAGNTSGASSPVTVLLDTVPPAITVTAPANNSYTNVAAAKVTGSLNEDASLTINGTETRAIGQSPLQFEKDITLTSGINSIQLTAKDAAGNQTTSTVLVTLDQTAPVVTIISPVSGAVVGSSTVTVTGTVNETVSSLKINGVSVGATAVVSGQGPGVSFNLASLNLSDGTNTITVEATDKAGNTGTATMQVSVDSMPPVVTLSAPTEAAAGATISISAGATDPSGVALIEILANGTTIWSENQWSGASGQGSVVYTLSPDIATGTSIVITAKATDATGLTGTATATITVSQGPTGPGYIQGEVYEDLRGLRLEGATAVVSGQGSVVSGNAPIQITTGADGGYFTEAPAGDYLITISKPGYTTVERKITVKAEKNIAPLDARLTPISTTQNLIDANGGKAKVADSPINQFTDSPSIELTIPSNALIEQADIRLTPLSNQGLMGVMPKGWSPIAAVDIKDNLTTGSTGSTGKTFDQAANLKVPVTPGITLEPASQVILAKYTTPTPPYQGGDQSTLSPPLQGEGQGGDGVHDWLVSSLGTVSADGKFITASVPSTGQYAFIIPDQPLTSAPSASSAVIDVLAVPVSPVVAENISATSKVKPAAAPPSVGLKAVGEVVITPSPLAGEGGGEGGLVSGFVVNANVAERFDLLSGEVETPSDYIQDLILYRYPCVTNIGQGTVSDISPPLQGEGQGGDGVVRTTFPISPSRDYSIIELMMGKVGLEITLPESDLSGTVVGPEGARLVDADGNVLNIPQGALTGSAPVEVKTIASSVSGIVGSDFTLLRAVSINLGGKTLSSSAELSIPAPQGINQNLPIVIARAIEVKGATKLKLIALGKISGSLISSSVSSATSVEGIKVSGTYYFLQSKSQLGFIQGKVTDASNNPYTSTLVTSNTCSLVDLTGTDGNYLIASKVSTFIATAADIYRNDKGIGSGTIASVNQTVTVNLTIKVIPPHIVSIAPDSGETAVDPKTSIVVTFSEAVDKNTVTSSNIYLKDSSGNTINGVFSVNPDGTEITLYPSELLKSEASYTVTVTKSIRDLQGYLMGQDVSSTFKIKDMTPPPMPPAGSITGTFPDENGLVTITATQGSAEANATVLIINDTTGEIVSVTPQTNGSFTAKITAQLGDEIKIVLMDAAGNQTLISYITFKSSDGKYLVTAKGGTVEGEGGTKLIIPEGALSGPAVIKITPVTQDQLPHPVPTGGKFLAAVNVDTGGIRFNKEVKLSVPAPADLPADATPFVATPTELTNADGTTEKVYEVINITKVADGRISTASPPFLGILAAGIIVYIAPEVHGVVISGKLLRDTNKSGFPDDTDIPVRGGIVRNAESLSYIAYSREDGSYAHYSWIITSAFQDCREFRLSATDPYTQQTKNFGTCLLAPPYTARKDFLFEATGANTELDKEPPRIQINLTSDKGFTAGTTSLGANITIEVKVSDNSSVNSGKTAIDINATDYPQLNIDRIATETINGNLREVLVYKASYKPAAKGPYTVNITAMDMALRQNTATKSTTFSVEEAGSIPQSQPGNPAIIDGCLKPADNAENVPVNTRIEVCFTEKMDEGTINKNTFTLIEGTSQVAGDVYTYLSEGKIKSVFVPAANLQYGKQYKIKLSSAIMDKDVTKDANGNTISDAKHLSEYQSTFATIKPQSYGLGEEQFAGGRDIAVMGNNAFVTAGSAGWKVLDIIDPTNPGIIYTETHTSSGTTWSYRGIAVQAEAPTMTMDNIQGIGPVAALTEDIVFADGARYGMLRLYDISNPASPRIVGHQKLHENATGVPGRLQLYGDYAFVTSVGESGAVQVVDMKKAVYGSPNNQAIVGFLDTQKPDYYGSPMDISILKQHAYLTTISGYLLVADINMPEIPNIVAKLNPTTSFQAWRVATAGDYTYTDAATGDQKTIDIAVVTGRNGSLYIVDITDPNYAAIISTIGGMYANDVTVNAINSMVFVTTLSGMKVIDIKNPYSPKEIYNDSTLGTNQAIVEKDGWVYTANQQAGMKVVKLSFTEPVIVPDYNHDKMIGESDKGRAAKGDKYYFWINDDDDEGETTGTDIPNSSETAFKDYANYKVDGVRDLIDFFPVYLNLNPLFKTYDPDRYRYLLRTEQESMNCTFTDLTAGNAGEYLTNLTTAQNLGNGTTHVITSAGIDLKNNLFNVNFLQKIKEEGKGIILIEGSKAVEDHLVVDVYDNTTNDRVFSTSLNVSLNGVEQMFRHKNLIQAGGGPAPDHGTLGGEPDRLGQPANYPDSETNGKNFVFLHGYNVNGQEARGWQAEMFKRMYWSGSKAKFWAVSWHGFDTQWVTPLGNVTPNYHLNVIHAMDTAEHLKNFINAEVKGDVTIAAHSLGNMVVSKLLRDWRSVWSTNNATAGFNIAKIKNYFLINAAVAEESYGATDIDPNMIHPDWKDYSEVLWASEWYTRFLSDNPSDNRSKLTWRNRFLERPDGTAYYNFYSSGEEVLAIHDASNYPALPDIATEGIGRYSWALQEKLKGRMAVSTLGSTYGGWGFNLKDYKMEGQEYPIPTSEANNIDPGALRTKPFFKKGSNDNDLFIESNGSMHAILNRNRLLAEAIPARTLAAGRNEVTRAFGEAADHNFDMQLEFENGWPRERNYWLHGDAKIVAYPYVYKLFDMFTTKGGLNQ